MTFLRRSDIVRIVYLLVGGIFIVRLLVMQVMNDVYKQAAEKNIIQPVISYPYRGMIYDRHGQHLVYNVPIYDLMVIPKEVKHLDKVSFCQAFDIPCQAFEKSLKKAQAYSYVKPSVFIKNLSQEKWARVQDHMTNFGGFFVRVRTVREYPLPLLAHTLGYIGEVSAEQLAADTSSYYKPGDMIGISGLEKSYEQVLRGKRGISYQCRDAQGIVQGSFKNGMLDRPPVPGEDLQTTLDTSLQMYGEYLMAKQSGSIVVIAPQTGEILALVSSPTYDPNLFAVGNTGEYFPTLQKNTAAPLLHRPIMAMYPPGSIFKPCQALIALQEKVIQPHTTHACNRKLLNCHEHPVPSNVQKAIQYSCNPYFYHVFKSIINQKVSTNPYEDTCIGLKKWGAYLKTFGFGVALGVDLLGEKNGHVPNTEFYDRRYGRGRWKTSTIRSLDIGQGELLVTPVQLANLSAIIANRGYYYTPYLIKQIGEQSMTPDEHSKHEVAIDRAHFELVAHAMRAAVTGGTAWRAHIPDMIVCAKTGTAENPHGADHAMCIAFAPQDNPQIALAVCVENAGWGARSAAAIAGLMIEKYLRGTVSRDQMETYVRKGNFSH